MIDVRVYEAEDGSSPFGDWFAAVEASAALRIDDALYRMRQGNLGDHKSLGMGLFERRIPYGPGYRIYFGRVGTQIVILVGGGTKKSQRQDIAKAHRHWQDYKARKRKGD
jgi:putative addiction module killer protein